MTLRGAVRAPNGDPIMKKATFAWPKGQRIAVTVSVMLEQWSEGKAPPWGVQGTSLKPGTLDRGGISWGTYGGKIGVWRIMNLLSQNNDQQRSDRLHSGERLHR
jgi:hypothetical protein